MLWTKSVRCSVELFVLTGTAFCYGVCDNTTKYSISCFEQYTASDGRQLDILRGRCCKVPFEGRVYDGAACKLTYNVRGLHERCYNCSRTQVF